MAFSSRQPPNVSSFAKMKFVVFLCLLPLAVVPSTKAITGSSHGYSINNYKLTHVEDELKRMQQDVLQLKSSATNDNKDCIARLEVSVAKVHEYMETQYKETLEKSEKIENLLDTSLHTIEKVRKELDLLRGHYEKSEEVAPKEISISCVKDIKSHDFKTAGEKIHKISEDEQIVTIVKDVYDHQPTNFDLVLSFGDSLGTQKKAFVVYKTLMSEMEKNGHSDILKTLRLIESISKKIIHEGEYENDIHEDALYTVFHMKNTVKHVAAEKLKGAMVHDDFKNPEIQKISDSIHDFSPELFEDMIRIVTREVYPKIGIDRVLDNIKCYGHIEEYISGYLAVYDVIRESGDPNHYGLFPLAEHIKYTLDMKNYVDVSYERKCIFEGLKYHLPKSVRNLVFLPKVCLKNIQFHEYLSAGGNHTEEKRNVHSWAPSEKDMKDIGVWGTWITSYEHGTFDIYNVYNKEYLYADVAGYDDARRYVFTWSGHKKKLPISSRWILIPDGEHVLIKNYETKEYLYVDAEKKHDSEKHQVFTLKSGKVLKESVWYAEDCLDHAHSRK